MRSIFNGEILILNNLLKSFGYFTRPGFKLFFFLPALVAICIGLALMVAGLFYLPKYFFLLNQLLLDFAPKTFPFLSHWLAILVTFATASLLIAFFFLSLKYVVLITMSPIMGVLTEKVYQIEQFKMQHTLISKRIWRCVQLNIRLIISEILITLLIITVCFFTGTSFLLPIILFVVQSYFVGCALIDFNLEIEGYSYRDSKLFFSANKWFCFGNGAIFMLLLAIPIIGILLACFVGCINCALSYNQYQQQINTSEIPHL
jgi:CysZ protein